MILVALEAGVGSLNAASLLRPLESRLRPGALVAELCGGDPSTTRLLGARLALLGVRHVDAPLLGSLDARRVGTSLMLLGGHAEDTRAVRELCRPLANAVEFTGGLGSAHTVEALGWALAVARQADVADAKAALQREGVGDLQARAGLEAAGLFCSGLEGPGSGRVANLSSTAARLRVAANLLHRVAPEAGFGRRALATVAQAERQGYSESDEG